MKSILLSRRAKVSVEDYLFGLLVLVTGILVFSLLPFFHFEMSNRDDKETDSSSPMSTVRMTMMPLTGFDIQLAKQFMDKDNDGKCDACGMPVEMCMDSGQMQCNMDPEATIGVLGSQHIHADWKIYINGKALDFSDKSHTERMRNNMSVSSFIHVESGAPAPEKPGDVLHMHATGVPLWLFFDSVAIKLPDGMKAYINGNEIQDYRNYVFQDLDRILITDGEGNIQEQLNSITNFAEVH